jgi:hypothetical protein
MLQFIWLLLLQMCNALKMCELERRDYTCISCLTETLNQVQSDLILACLFDSVISLHADN